MWCMGAQNLPVGPLQQPNAPLPGWCSDILGHLLPLFIDVMMDNAEEDWAMPLYPVIEE